MSLPIQRNCCTELLSAGLALPGKVCDKKRRILRKTAADNVHTQAQAERLAQTQAHAGSRRRRLPQMQAPADAGLMQPGVDASSCKFRLAQTQACAEAGSRRRRLMQACADAGSCRLVQT